LVGRPRGGLVGGGEVLVTATRVAGTPGLLAAAARRRRPGRRRRAGRVVAVVVRRVGQGIGDVRGFATPAVEALFEQADFGFEFVEALLALVVALLPARLKLGRTLNEEFLEFGFAADSALGEGLVEADLLACVTEELLAGGQATGSLAGQRVAAGGVVGFHAGSMPGRPTQG
jgi:hypothetical protein